MAFEFLTPVGSDVSDHCADLRDGQIGQQLDFFVGGELELSSYDIAIVGCRENRRSQDLDFSGTQVELVKNVFYDLYAGDWNFQIIDLGCINPGNEIEDTYYAIRTLSEACLKHNTILVVLGGGQDLNYPIYRSFDSTGAMVNFVNLDSKFDLGDIDAPLDAGNFVGKMVSEQPYNLFNYSNIAFQTYYNSQEEIDLLESLYFDAMRLGALDDGSTESEPVLRDADVVSVDMKVVEGGYLAFAKAFPNGLNGKQICSLMRYAGISDKSKILSISELPVELNKQSTHLIAQMMWYYIEGVSHRMGEQPPNLENGFLKYTVPNEREELVFYKSQLSKRWWMELPFFTGHNNKLRQFTLLACDEKDYHKALENELPERWIKARMKNEI
ncbi:arginase [Nonlabens spongiae]|uniref:Arginase n=1 Tax=Nonlabens spongiae TaxID=331648 RepID=A0A1W6MN22_9FLAO|nr:formimidoylglutamase [Nonlabens spongiae]ARN79013.1 arginase [Nonlabens spongiae]